MELNLFEKRSDYEWEIPRQGAMRVPAVIYASESLVRDMDRKVYEQVVNVATLPGIVQASYAMPDAHWGYGFPIGGVAAFDADAGGVVSAGGVGFDISCGVRCLHTGLGCEDILKIQAPLAHELSRAIPAGLGSTGEIRLGDKEMAELMARHDARSARVTAACRAQAIERPEELADLIQQLTDQMHTAAGELQFELAARLRDEVSELKKELRGMHEAGVAR